MNKFNARGLVMAITVSNINEGCLLLVSVVIVNLRKEYQLIYYEFN